jgi:protein tyrosine phosphatase (PTP) superfamily phosphohydrolase (DUF442 family)
MRQGWHKMTQACEVGQPSEAARQTMFCGALLRWGLRGLLLILPGLGIWWLAEVLIGANLHTVVPGRVYRGAQPTAASLERVIRQHGIRTIVNLRGCGTPMAWYIDEARVAQEHGIGLEDISFSAIHLPAPSELRVFLEVLERTEYPILLHCRHGADRTGLAAAIMLLLQDGVPYGRARGELGLYYGHLALGRTGMLDSFFDLYEDWLRDSGTQHSPERFRHWVLNEYRGGRCNGGVEHVEALGVAKAGRPAGYRVTLHNRSRVPWQLKPTATAGVHVLFHVYNAEGDGIVEGRAGMLEATIAPGGRFDVTMVLPPLTAGWYWLSVDLVEENHCCFYQAGAEPWEEELIVRE